jgi:hypothetical protein
MRQETIVPVNDTMVSLLVFENRAFYDKILNLEYSSLLSDPEAGDRALRLVPCLHVLK